jgi:hypothetical protein
MCVRLVHLLDDAKRKKLMIIYGEDLGPIGFSAARTDGSLAFATRIEIDILRKRADDACGSRQSSRPTARQDGVRNSRRQWHYLITIKSWDP